MNMAYEELAAAQRGLQLSEERFRIAAEHSSDIIIDYSIADNSLIHVTKRVEEIYGVPQNLQNAPEYLLTKGVVIKECAEDFLKMFREVREGKAHSSCVVQAVTVDSITRWLDISLNTIYDGEGKAIHAVGLIKDISEQKYLEEQYADASLYRTALLKDSLMYYEVDFTHHKLLKGHEVWLDMYGAPYTDDYTEVINLLKEKLVFRPDWELFLSKLSLENVLKQCSQGINKIEAEYRRALSNDSKWVKCTLHLFKDLTGGFVRGIIYVKDIDKEKRLELELHQKAERDLLTGLYNKITAEHMVRTFIDEETHDGMYQVSGLIIIDLDGFKQVNDRLGHSYGDAVLSETAQTILQMCRKYDIAGRIGGDEFILFLKHMPSKEAIIKKALMIKDALGLRHSRQQHIGDTLTPRVTASLGAAIMPEQGCSFEELYHKADLAMYAAKKNGRNGFLVYDDSMDISNTPAKKFLEDILAAQPLVTEPSALVPTVKAPGQGHSTIDSSIGKTFSGNIIEYVFKILYESRDISMAVQGILELLGRHLGYTRGYVYQRDNNSNRLIQAFSWIFGDNSLMAPLPESLSLEAVENSGFWSDGLELVEESGLSRVRCILKAPDLSEISDIGLQTKTIKRKSGWLGLLGFDKPSGPNTHELDILKIVGQMLDVFICQKQDERQILDYSRLLQTISNNVDTLSYVLEPATKRLLFVSPNSTALLPNAVEGGTCYELMRGRSAPCEDCPFDHMIKEGLTKYRQEMYIDSLCTWASVETNLVSLDEDRLAGLVFCYDITEYSKAEMQLEHLYTAADFTGDSTLYEALTNSTDDYIYICYVPKNLYYFPQAMVEEFDLPSQVIEDAIHLWASLIHEQERGAFYADIEAMFAGTNVHDLEYRVKNRQGKWLWVRCRGYLAREEDGTPKLFAGIVTNLEKKSKIDQLSGLLNKYEMENQLKTYLAEGHTNGALLTLGLDNFKHINNLYGWEFGDDVIRDTAQKLQSLVPSPLHVYRLDGDMFGILIPGDDAESVLLKLYDEIKASFQSRQELGGHRYYNTVSGGYALAEGTDVKCCDDLFKRSEYALMYAKSEGKNRVTRYSDVTMSGLERSISLIELMRDDMEKGYHGFSLNFQPQVNAVTKEVIGAEALVRWRHPDFGMVSPVEFIPLLERSGLIHGVGKWVFKEAAEFCRMCRDIYPKFTISVNLSYLQLMDKEFIPFMRGVLKEERLAPTAIHVELTETCIAAASHALTETFLEIRKMGLSLEMDDFGTGYSSLEILKTVPVNVVKIDRAFVKDITTSDFDATFIRFVCQLCHAVNMEVCLEGVETWEEYDLVSTMGLDIIQGYLFGKPMTPEAFVKEVFNREFSEFELQV